MEHKFFTFRIEKFSGVEVVCGVGWGNGVVGRGEGANNFDRVFSSESVSVPLE